MVTGSPGAGGNDVTSLFSRPRLLCDPAAPLAWRKQKAEEDSPQPGPVAFLCSSLVNIKLTKVCNF